MTAYELRISDWSSDVCSSDLLAGARDFRWRYLPYRRHRPAWKYGVRDAVGRVVVFQPGRSQARFFHQYAFANDLAGRGRSRQSSCRHASQHDLVARNGPARWPALYGFWHSWRRPARSMDACFFYSPRRNGNESARGERRTEERREGEESVGTCRSGWCRKM